MGAARVVLYSLHMLGVAALIAGFAVQLSRGGRGMPVVALHGAATQLVTGLALIGVAEADDRHVNYAKIAVKFSITVTVMILVLANRKKADVPEGLFMGTFGLVLVNIGLAFGWN